MLLKENNPAREKVNANIWHQKGYTGKGVTIVLLDGEGKARDHMKPYYFDVLGTEKEIGHATNVSFTVHQFAPDARILMFNAKKNFNDALAWIKNHQNEVDVINISLAGIGGSPTPQYLQLESLGIPVICASGNDDSEDWISYPAAYPFTIAVGAYEWYNDTVAGYSNEGDMLDAVSPSHIFMLRDDGYIWAVNGTSFAAPSASGLLACYIQWRKENKLSKLTGPEARGFIRSNCRDIYTPGFDKTSGYGLDTLPSSIPLIVNPTPAPDIKKYWRVQMGAFNSPDNAKILLDELKTKGYMGYIVRIDPYFKVQLGAFSVEQNCRDFSAKLKSQGINNFIVYY